MLQLNVFSTLSRVYRLYIFNSEHLAYLGDGWVEWRVEAEVVCPPDDEAKSLELEPRLCLRRLASASWSKEMERSTSGWPWWDEANPGATLYERRKWNSRFCSPWTHYHSRFSFYLWIPPDVVVVVSRDRKDSLRSLSSSPLKIQT